jgi:hypothetical protein
LRADSSPSQQSEPKPNASAAAGGENAIQGYWRVFGGITSLLRSTYFWASLFITSVLPKLWMTVGPDGKPAWAEATLDIAPSLLGFALGGMAIMLAFSSGRFLEAIRQKGKDKSYLRKMMASFFHFCIVLTAAILVAFVSSFYAYPVISFVGVLLSIYGLLLVVATASRIWHTARIFNAVSDYDETTRGGEK